MRPFDAPPKVSFKLWLPFKYLNTPLADSQWAFLRLCINCARSDTENAMLGHVPSVWYIREQMATLYGTFFI